MTTSGPTPAGSPGVKASLQTIQGLDLAQGFVTQCLQPDLQLLVKAPRAQHLLCLIAHDLLAEILLASVIDSQNVPAELGSEGRADLADRGLGHHGFELGNELSWHGPAQLAAAQRRADIFRVFARDGSKVGALHKTGTQSFKLATGFFIAADLVRLQEDVAYQTLLDHLLAVASLVELEEVDAGIAAYRHSHLAGGQLDDGGGEQARQLRGAAPAEVAPLQGVLTGRVAHGQLAKICATLGLLPQLFRLCHGGFDLFPACCGRQRQEDLADIHFRRGPEASLLGSEEVVYVLLADLDTSVHPVLLNAGDKDFLAQLGAKFADADAVVLDCLQKLLRTHALALGHLDDGLVELLVADTHPCFQAEVELQTLVDQAIQDLFAQDRVGRRLGAGLGDACLDGLQAHGQFADQYDVVLHYGGVTFEQGRGRLRGADPQEQAGEQDAERRSVQHKWGFHWGYELSLARLIAVYAFTQKRLERVSQTSEPFQLNLEEYTLIVLQFLIGYQPGVVPVDPAPRDQRHAPATAVVLDPGIGFQFAAVGQVVLPAGDEAEVAVRQGPERRDLGLFDVAIVHNVVDGHRQLAVVAIADVEDAVVVVAVAQAGAALVDLVVAIVPENIGLKTDRKSTRLNS